MINFLNKISSFFNTDTGENVAAFISGGIPATIVSYNLFDNVLAPVLITIFTGLIGGAAALLGKDLYKWCKSKILGK